MTRAFTLTQYAKDAAMDNSRIIFDRHTGDPCGWTDTAGKAHPLPVDFQCVSVATSLQFRTWALRKAASTAAEQTVREFMKPITTPIPADEQTMDHVDVREITGAPIHVHAVLTPDHPSQAWTPELVRRFQLEQRKRDDAADRREYWICAAAATFCIGAWVAIIYALVAIYRAVTT